MPSMSIPTFKLSFIKSIQSNISSELNSLINTLPLYPLFAFVSVLKLINNIYLWLLELTLQAYSREF